jgi:hypothetical protein
VTPSRAFILLLCLFTFGCGKSLEKQTRNQVRTLAGADWKKGDITVSNVKQLGDYAVADVTVKTAMKLRREGSKWVLDEVRLDDRRWESVDRIVEALEAARTRDTEKSLKEISQSIADYRAAHGKIPQVNNFDKLIDVLNPRYLDRVIRIDAWSSEFSYKALDSQHFELRSPGSDRRLGTADDLLAGN